MSEEQVNQPDKGIEVSAHILPPPSTVSEQAQAFLSQRMQGSSAFPDLADKAGWQAMIDEANQWLTAQMEEGATAFPIEIITHELERCAVYEVIPDAMAAGDEELALLYIHGGAFIHGGGMAGAYMGAPLTCAAGIRAFAVDYRMPPYHPFPAGLDDCLEAYSWLLENYRPENIAIAGGSAGGGMAGSLALKLRDFGLPLPGALVLATPEADLTESGDSFETNIHCDVVLSRRLTESIALYADGHDLTDPYLSPLFGDFTKGYPPTILTSGTRDAFLSNTVRMHRALLAAGIEAELHIWEAMPHGGFFGAPEDQEVFAQQAKFIRSHLGKT